MDINKGLLFLDGLAPSAVAKVIDLGFNGDFDHKNECWNRLFVAFAGKASGTDMTVKFYAKQSGVPSLDGTTDLIATLVIPAAKVQIGGAFAFPMPTGLKRYCTVAVSGSTLPSKVTVGITNDVDTDAIALGGGIDWTNYKASTLGTAVSPTPMKNVAALIKDGADAAGTAGAAVDAHEALTKEQAATNGLGTAHVLS